MSFVVSPKRKSIDHIFFKWPGLAGGTNNKEFVTWVPGLVSTSLSLVVA
jgi:hypothetical protein